ncbi:hypothetical protein JXA84_07510 [candidate division WOR-3 bacterium]|nr:hypothetical protein [candidate division WOR-3 bacterium]
MTGRRIPHVILLHHNLTSALFLDDLIQNFLSEDWEIVPPMKAYQDSVYSKRPDIVPVGESIVWALAKETGRYEERLRYPGEDGAYKRTIWIHSDFDAPPAGSVL